jgi:hypothetical protein
MVGASLAFARRVQDALEDARLASSELLTVRSSLVEYCSVPYAHLHYAASSVAKYQHENVQKVTSQVYYNHTKFCLISGIIIVTSIDWMSNPGKYHTKNKPETSDIKGKCIIPCAICTRLQRKHAKHLEMRCVQGHSHQQSGDQTCAGQGNDPR